MGRFSAALMVIVLVAACHPIVVPDVVERRPSPHPLWPRPVETVQTYSARPPNGVAVYGLEASGETQEVIEHAIRKKAAQLGCDGILYTVNGQPSVATAALTGKISAMRSYQNPHMDALCIVDPDALPPGWPMPTVVPAPAEAERAARSALEQWRLGYERRPPASHVRIADIQAYATGPVVIAIARLERDRSDAASSEQGLVTLVLQPPDTSHPDWSTVSEHASFGPADAHGDRISARAGR